MKKENLFGVYLTGVLQELCKRVGVDFADVDFTRDNWFLEHTWTQRDHNKFIEWLAQHLRNMGPRRELCKYPSLVRTKPERLKFATKFANQFSWKIVG